MISYSKKKIISNLVASPHNFNRYLAENIQPNFKRTLIAAIPKSGSTFLTKALSQVTRLKARDLVYGYGDRNFTIYPPRLMPALSNNVLIGHQHMLASDEHIEVLKIFKFKVIVLIRNFADCVVSYADHVLKVTPENTSSITDFQQFSSFDKDRLY